MYRRVDNLRKNAPEGSIRYDRDGYVEIKIGGRWQRRARYMVSVFLGRQLTRQEQVHHINENKADDRLDNFELRSPTNHRKLHNTPEHLTLISKAQRERWSKIPPEERKWTLEAKLQFSKARKGYKHSQATKDKIAAAHRGKPKRRKK